MNRKSVYVYNHTENAVVDILWSELERATRVVSVWIMWRMASAHLLTELGNYLEEK